MRKWFTEHPKAVGESYWVHMKFASLFGFKMLLGGLACLIHAIFPCFFAKTGSNFLIKLMEEFVNRMPKKEERLIPLAKEIIQKK